MPDGDLRVTVLGDERQPASVAQQSIVAFLAAAAKTVDIAVYDCALDDAGTPVAEAIQAAAQRGAQVRFAYFGGPHQSPIIPPPRGSSAAFAAELDVPVRPISGFQALMHHKYIIRDGEAVWTGSTNWTDDAWTREENLILEIPNAALAAMYRADFEQLWNSGRVENSGTMAGGDTTLSYAGQEFPAHAWFSPACGQEMAEAVGEAIKGAGERIVIASPVLTDGPIIGALRDVVQQGNVPVTGVLDATQMAEVHRQWQDEPQVAWKMDALNQIVQGAHLAGKQSTPYSATSVHDYMHAKVVVVDGVAFAGSYNFSRSGEENAENLLRLESRPLADFFASTIAQIASRYAGTPAWTP